MTALLAIFASAISPYHDARFDASARLFGGVHVVTTTSQGEFAEFAAERRGDYEVTTLFSDRLTYSSAVKVGDIQARVWSCLDAMRPDAVAVAGWAAPEGLAALTWGRSKNVPVVLMSESQPDDASRSFLRESVKRRVVAQFDAALVGGPPHRDYVVGLGISPSRVFFGYNAVDNEHFARGAALARQRREQLLKEHDLPCRYLLASARFIKKKNLLLLIRAYAQVRLEFDDPPDLVILGDGVERGHLEVLREELGLGANLHLPGFRRYDVLPIYYGLADAFCHVSLTEQWGLVVNEAMAAGLPVVVSNRCGVARTILAERQGGVVVEPTLNGIAEGLTTVLAMSAQTRHSVVMEAQEAVACWGPDRFANGLRSAVNCATQVSRRSPILPWDRLLIEHLQKRVFAEVA